MFHILSTLSRRRQLTLLLVGLFNVLLIGGLLLLVLTDTPLPPTATTAPDNSAQCEANAALRLRQRGVAASVAITQQTLLVTVIGPDAAAAWEVFSATVQLAAIRCGPYNLIRVDIPDPDQRPAYRLVLELTGSELQAWADGRLTDGQLVERTRRQLYQTVPN
jgi:hypothetical protein